MNPIRRRRLGGSLPFQRQIPGLVTWLKADTLGLADSTAVASWTDNSGLSNHWTQASGTLQPLLRTGILNGLPVVRFDGSNDSLVAPAALVPANGVFSAFFVVSPVSEAVTASLFSQYAAGQAGRTAFIANQNAAGGTVAGRFNAFINGTTGGASGGLLLDGAFTANSQISFVNTAAALGQQLWINGTLIDSATVSAVYTGVSTALGRDAAAVLSPYHGDIAEVLLYNRAVSSGDRLRLESYLKTKWGTP